MLSKAMLFKVNEKPSSSGIIQAAATVLFLSPSTGVDKTVFQEEVPLVMVLNARGLHSGFVKLLSSSLNDIDRYPIFRLPICTPHAYIGIAGFFKYSFKINAGKSKATLCSCLFSTVPFFLLIVMSIVPFIFFSTPFRIRFDCRYWLCMFRRRLHPSRSNRQALPL